MDIEAILSAGERVTLECKKAQRSVPNSLWETYSAFANTYGGIILLGVVEHMEEHDASKHFEIVGVDDADKIRKDFWNTINSREKVNINLLRDEDVQTIDADGKSVVVINVPRAESTMRPIYINNNLSRGTFKRNHEGDYHCTDQELKMMLRDANEAGNDRLNTIRWTILICPLWKVTASCSRWTILTMSGMLLDIRSSFCNWVAMPLTGRKE